MPPRSAEAQPRPGRNAAMIMKTVPRKAGKAQAGSSSNGSNSARHISGPTSR
jgi:hypothetical protein